MKRLLAWAMLISSLIGWPVSLWLTSEPPFILSLSWFALIYEAWNAIQIAEKT